MVMDYGSCTLLVPEYIWFYKVNFCATLNAYDGSSINIALMKIGHGAQLITKE